MKLSLVNPALTRPAPFSLVSRSLRVRAFVADCTASKYTRGGNWAPPTCANDRKTPPTHHVNSAATPSFLRRGAVLCS